MYVPLMFVLSEIVTKFIGTIVDFGKFSSFVSNRKSPPTSAVT